MKIAVVLAMVVGLAMMAFGWWGQRSEAGRRKYDEMDGIYPWIAMAVGGMIVVIGIAWLIVLLMWRPPH
jgi:hypothetical protein